MTNIAIIPIPAGNGGGVTYWAATRNKRSQGATAGEALDALTKQLTEEEAGTLVVIQSQRPDAFFSADQQKRLNELMIRWRTCRDKGEALPGPEQAELSALVDAELRAATERAAALADELKR
jgi:hypothetical protein